MRIGPVSPVLQYATVHRNPVTDPSFFLTASLLKIFTTFLDFSLCQLHDWLVIIYPMLVTHYYYYYRSILHFLILYTTGSTPCTVHQTVARPKPTIRTTKQREGINRHPCFKLDSNPRSECFSKGTHFTAATAFDNSQREGDNNALCS